jgi:hypothetical protein
MMRHPMDGTWRCSASPEGSGAAWRSMSRLGREPADDVQPVHQRAEGYGYRQAGGFDQRGSSSW